MNVRTGFAVLMFLLASRAMAAATPADAVHFRTSERCVVCHNGLATSAGVDVSIGHDWSASVMAHSARDPYWQASVRRELMDHPRASADIEDECAACHMPMTRYRARLQGRKGAVFANLAAPPSDRAHRESLDGVSCSVCHQISPDGLGAPSTWNGHFDLSTSTTGRGLEYGPYEIDPGLRRIMRSSTAILEPTKGEHIRRSELCASCHTLLTQALGPNGEVVGQLPEQVPFQEWQHSRYANEQSCQDCHMPRAPEPVAVSRVLGEVRPVLARHVFVGANFFLQRMLGQYRESLAVPAPAPLLQAAADRTVDYLATRAATIAVSARSEGSELRASVRVTNLGGHKLPTAYPARRAWLHVRVRDASGKVVFESGALRPDGSIAANDNDADPRRFEPHYREIRSPEQVQIYESILGDAAGQVTTALLGATHYLKDNRLLPAGFDKKTAAAEIRVIGDAAEDPRFDDTGHAVDYLVDVANAPGPFTVDAELMYQPIGFRWAHNLSGYAAAPEPGRFVRLYTEMQGATATRLAHTSATVRMPIGEQQVHR